MTKITGSAIHYILIFFVLICLLSPVSAAVIKSSNVWDQDQKMAATYIWTPNIYSGLWYDIDKGIQTEEITLTVSESDQTIRAGMMPNTSPKRNQIVSRIRIGEAIALSAGRESRILPDIPVRLLKICQRLSSPM